MLAAKGYSIWLMPGGKKYSELFHLIKKLSIEYSSVLFEPHLTLISGIKDNLNYLINNFLRLALTISPFKLKLLELKCSVEYFKSIFFEVEASEELMKAFLSARKLFNQLDNSSYHPHLSLMYSDVSLERKRKIANQIKLSKKSTILIDRVSLVQTIGAVEEWKVIKNIKLKITSA